MTIGKLYTPPAINKVAPKARENRWELVSGVSQPFAGEPKSNEFAYWFNYFWAEVVELGAITPLQQQKAAEVFFSVFEGAKAPFTLRADFALRDDGFKENVLRQLLLIGFRRIALTAPEMRPAVPGGRGLAPMPLVKRDAWRMNLLELDLGRAHGQTLPVAFRADLRSYDTLLLHGGFRARARSAGSPIYAAYGLNQAWHPYGNPVYRDSLFVRLGNKNADNCLHTVVSVGSQFAGITHFPILNDYVINFKAKSPEDGRFLALKPLDEWTPRDVQTAAADWQKVKAVVDSTGVVDHLEKENFIFAFHLQGVKAFNTQQFFTDRGHTPFPERAVEEIPLDNFLAEMRFVQKWYFNTEKEQIMLYELAFDPIRWLPSRDLVDTLIGEKARQQLEAIIQGEIQRARARSDITGEQVKYDKFTLDRQFRLTPAERNALHRALADFRRSPAGKGKMVAGERAAMIAQFGALKPKLEKIDASAWSAMRKIVDLLPVTVQTPP